MCALNNFFISFLFSVFTLIVLGKIVSYSLFEIKNENNFLGGVYTIALTVVAVIFSNVMVWIS